MHSHSISFTGIMAQVTKLYYAGYHMCKWYPISLEMTSKIYCSIFYLHPQLNLITLVITATPNICYLTILTSPPALVVVTFWC